MEKMSEVMELASLVKDNLSCKHLVLSVEEALVNFLQDDTSPEGVLELQPMSPYHRLLLHRLADIYGFAHESVGEGDDRHLVLERCAETTVPSIFVSDILWQHDEYPSSTSSQYILRRKEVSEVKKNEMLPSSTTFEEREAAYLAARERIFSLHDNDEQEVAVPKSRNVPIVARRMIAHALGTKISSDASDDKPLLETSMEASVTKKKSEDNIASSSENSRQTATKLHWHEKKSHDKLAVKSSRPNNTVVERKGNSRAADFSLCKGNSMPRKNNERVVDVENLKREQMGAAKRIFAQALGRTPARVNQGSHLKCNQGNQTCS